MIDISTRTAAARPRAKILLAAMSGWTPERMESAQALLERLAPFGSPPETVEAAAHPRADHAALIDELFASLGQSAREHPELAAALLGAAARKELRALPELAALCRAGIDEALGIQEVVVSLPPAPAGQEAEFDRAYADQRPGFLAALGARSGKTIRLVEKTDPSLVGGGSARIGDDVFELSVASQLRGLREQVDAWTRAEPLSSVPGARRGLP